MFREMRRSRQSLTDQESIILLEEGSSGVLAVAGDDGYPYAVPLSYVYDSGSRDVYFHCALSGHKLDAVHKNPKVSFCVIGQDQVVPEEYTTYYRSVIVFGTVCVIEDQAEKTAAANKLAEKYTPDDTKEQRQKVVEESLSRMHMLKLQIEHMTGKESIELKNLQ